jgi:tripartite-type tricarboxylate transporter receptor subunit TctC
VTSWYGLLAPANTPKPIIDKLQQAIAVVMKIPEVRERYLKSAFEPVANSPEAFANELKADYERWGKVVKEAKVSID